MVVNKDSGCIKPAVWSGVSNTLVGEILNSNFEIEITVFGCYCHFVGKLIQTCSNHISMCNTRKLGEKWEPIYRLIDTDLVPLSLQKISELELELNDLVGEYGKHKTVLHNFLVGVKTEESQRELSSPKLLHEHYVTSITLFGVRKLTEKG